MAYTIEQVRNLGSPQKSYNFEIVIPDIPGGASGDSLRLRVNTATIPGFGSNEPIEAAHGGHVVKYPGRGTYPRTWTFEVMEYEDMFWYDALQKWHALQWDRDTGVQQTPDQYKKTVEVHLLNSNKDVTMKVILHGAYIEDVPDVTLDYNSSTPVNVSVTLGYDNSTIEKLI